MAENPTVSAPTISQSGAPLPVSAPAEAFSGNVIGGGLQQVGVAAQQSSDMFARRAEAFQALNNEQDADNRTVGSIEAVNKVSSDYMANNAGEAAYTNLPTAYKNIETARASFAEGLSPIAMRMFDTASKRYVAQTQAELTGFAQRNLVKSRVDSKNALIATYQANALANPDDDNVIQTNRNLIAQEVGKLSSPSYLGLSDDSARGLLQKSIGTVDTGLIKQAFDSQNILKAQDLFQKYRGEMTAEQIDAVAGNLKAGALQFNVKGFADDIAQGRVPTDRGPAVSVAGQAPFLAGIHGTEGTGQNSLSTASGVGQFTEGTWLGTLKNDPSFAGLIQGKSDSDILALRNNPKVADAAIISLANENSKTLIGDKISPTEANVGLMHHFGSGDGPKVISAAPETPISQIVSSQVIAANPDLADKTAGDVQSHYQKVFGTDLYSSAGTTVQPQTFTEKPPVWKTGTPADTYQGLMYGYVQRAAEAIYGDQPDVMSRAIEAAKSRVDLQVRQYSDQQKDIYGTLSSYVEKGLPSGAAVTSFNDLPPDQVKLLPPNMQGALALDVNRAIQGYGGYKTPAMQNELDRQIGLRNSNPSAFADGVHNNIQGNTLLSAADKARLLGEQGAVARHDAAEVAHQQQYKSYLSVPTVSNFYHALSNDDDKNLFIGRLEGRLQALHPDGKPATQAEIQKTGADLAATQGGIFGMGGAPTFQQDIPDADKAKITTTLTNAWGRAPAPWEVDQAYDRFRTQ